MLNFSKPTNYDELSYSQFSDICLSCENCDLSKTRTQVVIGHGPIPCNIMVIGEAPGAQEDMEGKPFIGRAGQLLNTLFDSVKINREKDTYITNTLKCRPPKNRPPSRNEIEACKPFLIKQINLVQPKIMILLGAPALKTILEEPLSISKVRGKWYKAIVSYMPEPLRIMPLFHPSYLLRNQSKEEGKPKWLTCQDMKEIKSAINFYNHAPFI